MHSNAVFVLACLSALATCGAQEVAVSSKKSASVELQEMITKNKLKFVELEKVHRESFKKQTVNSLEDDRNHFIHELSEIIHQEALFCYHFELGASMLVAFEDRPNIKNFQIDAAQRLRVRALILKESIQAIAEIRSSTKDTHIQRSCDESKKAVEEFYKELIAAFTKLDP